MPNRLSVLLVDDDPDVRLLVQRELSREFANVQTSHVFEAAALADAFQRQTFDLVITDCQLCWTDGVAVLQAARSRSPYCPVIMFTGTDHEETAVEAIKSGLDDYVIKKPSHFRRIGPAARCALERSRLARRAAETQDRLQSMLLQLNVGAFRCTPQGQLLEWNDVFAALLRPPPPSVERTPRERLESFLRHPPCARLLDAVSRSGESETREFPWRDSRGSQIWFSLTADSARTAVGETAIDGMLEEITVRKRFEEQSRRRAVAGARLSLLSPRERDVLELVVAGRTNKVIAHELNISSKTVEMHRGKLSRKLRVGNVADLVRFALSAAAPDAWEHTEHDPQPNAGLREPKGENRMAALRSCSETLQAYASPRGISPQDIS